MNNLIKKTRNFYARWERPISSMSLVGGFVFDAVTLRRIDMFWENLWVIGHIIIVATFIVLVNSKKHRPGDEADPTKANFWYVNILQFFFGGLLSTYLVFYFRSADLMTSWPFILILVLAFWANESLKRHYARLSFQISLFFLSLYSFAIFLLPVVLHSIGSKIFLLSGLLSLILISLLIYIIKVWSGEKFRQSKKIIIFSISAICVLMNVLYFTNIIPPIPLSIKDDGVFHSIQRDGAGNYVASWEDHGLWGYLTLYKDIHVSQYAPVYVYSAVFSPTSLNTEIIHRWQYLNSSTDKWVDKELVSLPLIGGREGGYRTYSMKSSLSPGRWRVSVETTRGQVLGRIRFNVINTSTGVVLSDKTL